MYVVTLACGKKGLNSAEQMRIKHDPIYVLRQQYGTYSVSGPPNGRSNRKKGFWRRCSLHFVEWVISFDLEQETVDFHVRP